MTPKEAQHKIEHLSTEIEQHNYNYYVLDKPNISDFEFDKLLEEQQNKNAITPTNTITPEQPK